MSNSSSYDDDQSLLSRPIVRFGLIWGVWTIVTLFFSTQAYIARDPRRPMSYLTGLLSQASACYLWALATPLVLWLAQRYRIERRNWGRRLLLHLLVSLGLVSVILLINYPIFASITGAPITRFWLFRFLYVNLDRWLLIYWVILMISHAFNYYNNYRKGELKASGTPYATRPIAVGSPENAGPSSLSVQHAPLNLGHAEQRYRGRAQDDREAR